MAMRAQEPARVHDVGWTRTGISGQDHTSAAVRAATALLVAVSSADATTDGAIPVGAAVHTGNAFVGSTGTDGSVSDFTALGDVVNTTARLASQATAGELLVSVEAAGAAQLETSHWERRTLTVRGRSDPVEVFALRPATLGV